MVHKYIIDKADIHDLLTGKEIPLPQGNKARAFCVEIAGGMTNGEVIQALFPNMKTEDTPFRPLIGTDIDKGYVLFNRDWWNAPYQKGGE